MNTVTSGVSPKTLAAGFAPVAGGLLVGLANLAITGSFDGTSLAAVVAGSGGGVVSTIAAYLAKPGPVHEIVQDLEAVAKADPGLVKHIEGIVKAEVAKLPAGLDPLIHVAEDDLVDPIVADLPETPNPPVLGDAGVAHVDPPDPRDAQIADLQAQLAAAQAQPAVATTSGAGITLGPSAIDPVTSLPTVVTS